MIIWARPTIVSCRRLLTFREDQICIDNIIEEQKREIQKTHEEVERLKEQYKEETLKGQEEITFSGKEALNKRSENEQVLLDELENELIDGHNKLSVEEESYKKSTKIVQDACTTVSRIMYQLEPKYVGLWLS